MATATLQRTSVCAGGGHHVVKITAAGQEVSRTITLDDLGPLTAADLDILIPLLARAKKQLDGLTNGQTLAAFVAGVTVTL